MRAEGYENPGRAITRWVQRKHVPSDACFMLLGIAEANAKVVAPADCVIERISDGVQFRSGMPIEGTAAMAAGEAA